MSWGQKYHYQIEIAIIWPSYKKSDSYGWNVLMWIFFSIRLYIICDKQQLDCCCSQVAVTMSIFSFTFLVSNVLFRCVTWQTEWEVMHTMTEEEKRVQHCCQKSFRFQFLCYIVMEKNWNENCTPHVQKITMMK